MSVRGARAQKPGLPAIFERLTQRPASMEGPPDERVLRASQFRAIATRGFGDPQNSYPHAMAWFRDRLFVGTTRNILQLVSIAPDPSTDAFHLWPVRVPDGTNALSLDQRCQIWRYDPLAGAWEMTFQSPRLEHGGHSVWRDFGYRNMVVMQTRSDRQPALYVTTMSSSRGNGASILRSEDGIDFQPVTKPGLGDAGVTSFRALVAFRDRLYTAPAGRAKLWTHSDSPVVLECFDPRSHDWRAVCEPAFGDPTDLTIFEMAVFNDHLYAGTGNAADGFHVWKTDAKGAPPYTWKKVITAGAYRGRLNEVVMSMTVFNNALYVGGGVRRGGFDREYKVGPAAAEVIRIHPDDSWDLVAGTPRLTPEGAKKPLSGLGPGFGNPFTGYIWCMQEHDGVLYVGTYDSSVFLSYVDLEKVPERKRFILGALGPENIVRQEGGFDLWASADGVSWTRVTRTGFGNPYNYGVRTMASTPAGLFVGVANPFGPDVAMQTPAGWTYAANPKGGLEVWLGDASNPAGEADVDAAPAPHSPASVDPAAAVLGPARAAADAGDPAHPGEAPTDAEGAPGHHLADEAMLARLRDEFYENSEYQSLGYWRRGTKSQKEACDTLMEKLYAGIRDRSGTILEVACGRGATTRWLAERYPDGAITGIDANEENVAAARRNAPGASIREMEPTALDFPDASFDNVLCVQAAFHFNTRAAFLKEALRVLKPGGRLVLSDVLTPRRIEEQYRRRLGKNYLRDPEAYRRLLRETGFADMKIVDATTPVWEGFCMNVARFATKKLLEGEIEFPLFKMALGRLVLGFPVVDFYLLIWAQKGSADAVPTTPGSTQGQ